MIHPEHHGEDNRIHDNEGTVVKGGDATIHDRTGLYIAILSLIIATLCLGLFLMQTMLMPQIIDSKIQAGIAKAEATAHDGDVNARAALYNVQKICAEIRANGMKSVDCH